MNKYDWGIYSPVGGNYDPKEKERNINQLVTNMLNKSVTMFDYQGLPETIPPEIIERYLQCYGYVTFIEHEGNFYVVNGALGGEPNIYNEPTQITVSNPVIGSKTFDIDVDCIVISNDYMKTGLLPIYNRYCYLMVENDVTMVQANINQRIASIITANDDPTRESAELYLKKIEEGKTGVIMDNKLFDSLKVFTNNSTNNVQLMDLVQYQQYLKASLYNEIGLNSNYNMKKERLISGELEQNADILYPLVDGMLECRQAGIKKVNEMFDLNITVELDSSWNREKATPEIDEPEQEEQDPEEEKDPEEENESERG